MKPVLRSTQPAAYFDACCEAFACAAARLGMQVHHVRLMGEWIRLCFAGDALAEGTLHALAHHLSDPGGEAPSLTLYLWDAQTAQDSIPVQPWMHTFADLGSHGEIVGFNRDGFRTIELIQAVHGVDLLNMVDTERGIGLVYAPSGALPYWMASFPLYLMLHLWSLPRKLQMLHAGAVGQPDGGVLIVGKSGSGKSTTTLSCLHSSLRYAGDDYVMVSTGTDPHVYNLYNTAKLEADNLFRLPHLRSLLANPDKLGDEKALIYLNERYQDALIDCFPLRAILVPHITGQADTQVRPVSTFAALAALAPSTLAQLRAGQGEALTKIKALTERVPCYTLELGTELTQIPRTIQSLLAALSKDDGS
ncbi:MAG: hypothetical protein SF162_18905 [bacterium]|nr:hypothetical protein [bacterium]